MGRLLSCYLQKDRFQYQTTQIHLVLEPTGGYELGLVTFAHQQGWLVSLPNPKQVRRWAEGVGKRAKTDQQDARLLAEFGAKYQPKPQQQMPAHIRQLDSLLRRQDDLEKLLRAERNRQQNQDFIPHTPLAVSHSLQTIITALETEIKQIHQAIKNLVKEHTDLKQDKKRLLSVPGIGRKTVLPLLVLLHRWQALTNGEGTEKGLTAFLGLDPQPYESGRSVSKRATISKMGDRSGRCKLYMAALGGVRAKNSPLCFFYQRLVGRGKAKRLALVAASRKILVWSWVIFSWQSTFDASRFAHLQPNTSCQ